MSAHKQYTQVNLTLADKALLDTIHIVAHVPRTKIIAQALMLYIRKNRLQKKIVERDPTLGESHGIHI